MTLFLALVVQISFAQDKTITGTVTDQDGLPLPGVNILVEGTTNGTQTDFDGNYSMAVSAGQSLEFSYIGYKTVIKAVGAGSSTIDLQMAEDAEALDEVVVTALGISREKKSLGYATQEVQGDRLTGSRVNNALNALSGQVAGVQVSNGSGGLGSSSRILIRGVGSVSQENRPLIVVDGIPLDNSNFNTEATNNGSGGRDFGDAGQDINPDDIASLNVLKGGPAAALYGSRASNGVILITTKSGKAGNAEITINSGITFERVNIFPEVQKLYGGGAGDPSTIGQVGFNQATIDGRTFDVVDYATDESWGPRYDPNRLVLHWDAFDPEFTDDFLNPRAWVFPENDARSLFETGTSTNNGLAFTKGNEDSNMRLSLNNTQTTSILPNANLDRTTINFSGSSKITDKLKVNATVNFTITDGFNRPAAGYTGEGVILGIYHFSQTSLDFDRLRNYITADGTQRTWNRISALNGNPRFTDNPYWTLFENTANDKRTRWYGTVGGTYNITDDLYVVANAYADTYSLLINERTAVGSQAQPAYSQEDRVFQELNYEGRLHYDKNLLDNKLSINSFVGMNRRDNEFSQLSAFTNGGLVVPGLYNISNSAQNPTVTELDTKRRINSVFGSVSLGYDSFAYVTITGRNDWSSTLPASNNSYFYPSFTGSFVFSKFLKNDWLTFGKIRGGYAEVGSDTDPFSLINTFVGRDPFLGSVPFTVSSSNRNSNLRPEEKQTYEFGLELALFQNRVRLDLTYYNETTNDLITGLTVDPSTGFTSTIVNAGSLKNEGIEALVNITPVQTDNFNWDFTWNFAKNNNTLLSLSEGIETFLIGSYPFNGVSINAVVGESYGQIRGTNFVFDDDGNKVVDADGCYLETQNVENLGSVLPDYNMGFRNSFSYKNVSASFLIDVQSGGKYRSLSNIWGHYSGILEETAINNKREVGVVLEGVTGDVEFNDDGTYTVTNTAENTTVLSAQQEGQDYFFGNDAQNVFDADYVKLREVTLSYDIPVKFLNVLKSARLSAFGRNLFIWGLDNDNYDPEVATTGSGNTQGSEAGSLPTTRTYGVNLQLKF